MEADQGLVQVTNFRGGLAAEDEAERQQDEAVDMKLVLKEFVERFRIHNDHLYMAMLRANLAGGLFFLEVEMAHVQQFSGTLFNALHTSPTRTLPLFEHALWELAQERKLFPAFSRQSTIQLQLYWGVPPTPLRQLAQASVARLVCVSGIVVKASACHARCVRAAIQCTSCSSKTYINGGRSIDLPPHCLENGGRANGAGGFGGAGAGGGGQRKCRPNPYTLLPMECEYEDQQIIKLQELPEDVPTGELPRHVTVVVDRYLVDRVSPGSRVQVAGIVSVQEKRGGLDGGRKSAKGMRGAAGLRAQYLRCIGLMYITAKEGGTSVQSVNQNFSSRVRSQSVTSWQAEEEAAFKRFAEQGHVYERLAQSIDPAIFGLEDQKKAIVCLLFGGTRKKQGSNYLRGDMNVLFIGDPSTAKSQLLKFTEKVAPIGIYTSGKGSSAAGLTASVISNGNGDFVLEAGSMVLADGGVVCIDEFDKMREQDQVAIHEAMEQQTISIAKANLTTMLNSRTSVLAAANPTLGSYDPLRSNEDQMDFQSSILSRFDLIFKVLDPRNPEIDNRLAQHVVNLHKGGSGRHAQTSAASPSVERSFFTKYISYARATRQPRISEDAMSVLLDFYVHVRRDAHQQTLESISGSSGSTGAKPQTPIIQITARQLESLVRITESLARMRLDVLASRTDAEEAIRLFKMATVDAIKSGVADQSMTAAQSELMLRIEEALRRRVALGATVEQNRLLSEMARMGFDVKIVERAVYAMVKREELEWRKQRTLIHRLR
ncbi:putative minichromosome maintenance (MCM) complex subunit [Trypanosoma grayi]|uniref:putative minichromosome maintenance (MCM) complex subunit n=1 Tax=Trypanosoma grayi TaxID=71804 RepID=UPI0004F42A90|nr:putative minichromosome maintenance (MCM) complex subunit [Trypanosoma grayi]KEG10523.1 putative minichromosome maintenance (MCM) complex subunit [Trypanosoma grayi]